MKIKQKLIPAIAMLVISAIALTTASLAWFSMSTTATVTTLSLTAATPSNILVKSTWGTAAGDKAFSKSNISIAVGDGTQAETDGYSNATGLYPMLPTSSISGFETSFFGSRVVGSDGAMTEGFAVVNRVVEDATSCDTVSQYYIDVPLSFITTGPSDVDLLLDYARTNVTVSGGASTLYKAVRVAFLNTSTDAKSSLSATNYIFAKDIATATDFDAVKTLTAGAITATQAQPYMTANTDVLRVIKYATSVAEPTVADAAGTSLVVRIWLEGQDSHCTTAQATALALNNISISLAFIDAAAIA